MQENSTFPHRRLCLFGFVVISFILTVFYYGNDVFNFGALLPTQEIIYEDLNFLVSSSKCKILDLSPYNKDAKKFFHREAYKPCRQHDLLTYVTKKNNTPTLYIDEELIPSYSANGVSCCYSNVTRKISPKDPDGSITITKCQGFKHKVTIGENPVIVKCSTLKSSKLLYENAHVAILTKNITQNRSYGIENNTKPLSVLIIGIDSVSRLHFIRALPNTYHYVEDNNWIPLKGYNKMGDNTFPNLMATLTGYNNSRSYEVCNPKVVGYLDKCPLIWKDYKMLGFTTAYAEDEGSINTFNYRKKGFTVPPTDYYFRPYVLATEKLKTVTVDGMLYCTGPETAGERIMNIAKDFAITLKDHPTFGFFWMNSFSHNKLNAVTRMDGKVKDLLANLADAGVMNNSIVILLSDHGARFGDIRLTDTGWLEERLPFIYFSLPEWFKAKYPNEVENLKANRHKLTTPYDLHLTLKHILQLSGHNYTRTPSDACPKCKSVFEVIESERSCEDAGIEQHWCTCLGYTTTDLKKEVKTKVTNFMLGQIDNIIRNSDGDKKCAKFSVDKIISSKVSQYFKVSNETFLLVKLKTIPHAIFEATIRFLGDITAGVYFLTGDISRLDSYNDHSKCVSDSYLRKYCYCPSKKT